MAGFTEGPQVGLKVAAAPTSQALRTRTSDAEVDSFVKGLGSLNSALQNNFDFERKQDLEAGRNAGMMGQQQEETPSRSFHEGWLMGSGEAAAIRDSQELKAKILTEAPADPVKAAQISKDFYSQRTQGLSQPQFESGYSKIMANESARLQAQAGENNAKEILAVNESNAFARIQYTLERAGRDHNLTWAEVNKIAADHALTGTRKDQMVLEALRGAAEAGNMDALAILKAARTDAKTGNSFPALADNPSFVANVQMLYTTADNAQQKNLREEVDQKLFPELRLADKGELDVKAFLAWAQDPKYQRVVSASMMNTVLNANEAALLNKQRQADRMAAFSVNQTAKEAATQAATAAVASGNGTQITSVNIPSKTGDGEQKLTAQELQKAGFEGWVSMAKPGPEEVLHKMSRTIGEDGRPYDHKELTNPFRLLNSSGLRSAIYVKDPKTGESVAPPPGPLPPEVEQQLATFNGLDKNYGPILKSTLGEETYNRLNMTNVFKSIGLDSTTAAALAHNSMLAEKTPGDSKEFSKAIAAATKDTVSTHMLSWVPGFKDNDNITSVEGKLRQVSYALMKSGFFPDAKAAVQEATKLLAPQMFTANSSVYYKSDFPAIPAVFNNDGQAAIMTVLDNAKTLAADPTVSTSDLLLDKLPDGRFAVRNKDGSMVAGKNGTWLLYDNGTIGRLWSSADRADIEARYTQRTKAQQANNARPSADTKTSNAKRRGTLAMEAANRAAVNQ